MTLSRPLTASLVTILLLGGCQAAGPVRQAVGVLADAETAEERQVVAQIAREDLEEALRSAEVHDDPIAVACWSGLLVRLDSVQEGGYFTDVKGAFSGFQKARNIRRALTEGVDVSLKIACAALRSDSTSALLGIARMVGLP